ELFQKYLKEDCLNEGKSFDEAQALFYLEEHLLVYLMAKGEVSFHNNHVQNRQRWLLWCYPGKPPKALIYLFQLNPFKLSWKENDYQSCVQYDFLEQKLYDVDLIDLEQWA